MDKHVLLDKLTYTAQVAEQTAYTKLKKTNNETDC